MRSATSITSLSLWVMKMIDLPLSISVCRILKSPSTSCGVKHGRRLVQDQDVRRSVKDLDDFNSLLYPHGKVLDVGIRIDLQPVLARDFPDALRHVGLVQE